MSRATVRLATLVGAVCVFFLVRAFFFGSARSVRNDLIQGVLVGAGLALVTATALGSWLAKTTNGWVTMRGLGAPTNGMFVRAAHTLAFPGPVNVPEEAVYWRADSDAAGRRLSGARRYIVRFPPGGVPPSRAFWSLTMSDAKNRFVANPLGRFSVGDRTRLVANPDGSIDVYLQRDAPPGRERNWLPAPEGAFVLWLRAYLPDEPILRGDYAPPPVLEAR